MHKLLAAITAFILFLGTRRVLRRHGFYSHPTALALGLATLLFIGFLSLGPLLIFLLLLPCWLATLAILGWLVRPCLRKSPILRSWRVALHSFHSKLKEHTRNRH